MEKMGFERYGFQTVFGFTDSIFIRHNPSNNTTTTDLSNQYIAHFLEDCQHQLNVNIEHKNRFLFTIIFDKKNRYIACTGKSEDRPILKNLDGISRKYPTWIKHQIEKVATCLITKSNVNDIIPGIKQAFEDLDYGRFEAKDISTKVKDLSVRKYKQIFWDKIEDMLEIADYNVVEIKQDLLYENDSMIITNNSRK